MNLSDVLSKVNKEFKKELAIKGIGDIKIKSINEFLCQGTEEKFDLDTEISLLEDLFAEHADS